MLKRFLATLVLGLVAIGAQANENYTLLAKPGKVEKPGMIEVREFFWYGCGHCYNLEPHVKTWLKSKPADVNFVRTPAALNPVWEQNARGYYTAEMMGVLEQSHDALFQAIHVGKQKMFDQASLSRFYSGFGADPKKFDGLFNSLRGLRQGRSRQGTSPSSTALRVSPTAHREAETAKAHRG